MQVKLLLGLLILRWCWCQAIYNDPQWANGSSMWYWQRGRAMKLYEAWQLGLTGLGVNIAVVDDGVNFNSPDIKANYKASLSFDYYQNQPDASPRFSDEHGTNVASVAAGVRDNNFCGFGAAPRAGIISTRIFTSNFRTSLDPLHSVLALIDKDRHIHTGAFIRSWGASDDGDVYSFPTSQLLDAQVKVAEQGRGGKGAFIFVSAGNGGQNGDDCGADGYVQSPYVIAVQGVDQDGSAPNWTENCAAAFTSAYVGSGLVTAAQHSFHPTGCKTDFGGTSAAAPVIAGVMALAMEHNPALSRVDLIHLLVKSSDSTAVSQNGWQTNAAGVRFHYKFGFGLLNAHRLVDLAGNTSARFSSKFVACEFKGQVANRESRFEAAACNTAKVEHVTVIISAKMAKRGEVEVLLSSPSSTTVRLLGKRRKDTATEMNNWHLTTPFFWNETIKGSWKLSLQGSSGIEIQRVSLQLLNSSFTETETGGLKTWQIALIVIAGLGVVGAGIGVGVCIARKSKKAPVRREMELEACL